MSHQYVEKNTNTKKETSVCDTDNCGLMFDLNVKNGFIQNAFFNFTSDL